MAVKNVRYYIFLRDVILVTFTAFGGPQAHIALFIDIFCEKRGYLNEKELLELNALCQILPGPTSTQTITAIAYKIGGAGLAYMTLLIWALPAVTLMTIAGISISYLQEMNMDLSFTRFIQPMAVGFVAYAAIKISMKVIESKSGILVMILSAILSYFIGSPFLFPILLILGGTTTALKYKKQPVLEKNEPLQIKWGNFLLWGGVLIVAASIGAITKFQTVRLFENFYRNGSLIFGGGQVLIPLLHAEFVQLKDFLTSSEFLSGYGIAQALPGPVFSFSSFVGALSMRDIGLHGQIAGALAAAAGIFLPGTFLIFFVYKFWTGLKRYRIVRASLEGINAASSGMVAAACVLLYQPLENNWINPLVVITTFCLLRFTKVPAPFIVVGGLALGFLL